MRGRKRVMETSSAALPTSSSGQMSGQTSVSEAPRSTMPRAIRRKCVRGMISPMTRAQPGIPSKGNMKPDKSICGRNEMKVI